MPAAGCQVMCQVLCQEGLGPTQGCLIAASNLLGTLALRETSIQQTARVKSASNFKAMAFVWLLWLTVPTLLSNELSKLKRNCGPFEKLFKSYCEYKDGQMPGKHGWHDGSTQLYCEDGDLEAHAKSKKNLKPIKGLIHSFT